MKKQNGYRILTALLLALAMLLGSALAAETDPAKMIYTDYGAGYHLTTFLSGYNVIAFGNVSMQTHCMGAVLIEGDFEGAPSGYSDGDGLPPSYIKGYIAASPAVYNSRSKNNPPLYVGPANVITTQWGNYQVNGQSVGWGKNAAYQSENFFNFDEAYEVIRTDAQSIIRRADEFDPDVHTSEDVSPKFWIDEGGHLHIRPGANVVLENLDGIEDISLEGDMSAAVNTTITILQSGHVELPFFLEQGKQPSSTEQSDIGMSIVWNIPNASLVHVPDLPWFGHIVAPDSDIRKDTGNYNGALIGRNVILGGGAEGHVYRYNTEETSWDIVFSLEKLWHDGDDADGIRPSSVKVQLYADGKPYGDVVTITAAHNWYHVWKNLPERNEDGDLIEYSVEEKDVPEGYTSSYDPETQTLINTHEPEKTEVTITKNWMNEWFGSRNRPRYITVRLYANGREVASEQIAVDYWAYTQTYTFRDLPKYDGGELIEYVVHEDMVPGYTASVSGTTITNSFGGTPVDVFGSKAWDDEHNQDGIRPTSVTVQLLADGKVIEEHVVYAKDNWEFAFTNLPMQRWEGAWPNMYLVDIVYTVREKEVPAGYEAPVVTVDENNKYSFTITNTHEVETVDLSGGKTWDDDDDNDGKRPKEITVYLMADHVKVDEQKVSEANGWKWSFTDKPRYHGGKEIHYTVTDEVTGYEPINDGMNLTNRHENETVDVTGVKYWHHGSNPEDNQPESIVIELYQDGKLYDSRTVTADDSGEWRWAFTELPKYTDRYEHVYTIREQPVPGYKSDVDGWNVTNTYDNISVSGEKTWNHGSNTKLPESITINLLANGEKIASQTVTEDKDGAWKWEFTDLPKKDAQGNEITYTISEDPVPGYKSEVDGWNVTNTYDNISVSGEKTWNHGSNTKLPVSITINLLANGEKIASQTVTEDKDGAWKWEFTDLPKKDAQGNEIAYTISEDAVPGYHAVVNGYDVTNTYHTGSVELTARKTINGAPAGSQHDGLFTFVLSGSDGEIERVTNTGADIAFAPISYTLADVGETYVYTVSEISAAQSAYQTDDAVYTVTVSIGQEADGSLQIDREITSAGKTVQEIVFNNIYDDQTSLKLTARKQVNGVDAQSPLHDGFFTFVLKDQNGEVIQTQTNTGAAISFDPIGYSPDQIGETFVYTVQETAAKHGAYSLDSTVYTVTVTVGQDDEGRMTANAVYSDGKGEVDGIVFNNRYVASVKMAVRVGKMVDGFIPTDIQVYTFFIEEARTGSRAATGQNQGDMIVFSEIEFTQEDLNKGVLEYVITEDTPSGYECLPEEIRLLVMLTDSGDGSIEVDYSLENVSTSAEVSEFNNVSTSFTEVRLVAAKTVNGAPPAANQVFTFELVDDATGEVIQTKQNVQGTVTFDAIGYKTSDAGKTYTYTIREAATTLPGVTIDGTEYTAVVTLTDVGGSLTANVVYKKNGETVTGAAFNNTYEASGEAYLTAAKTVNGAAPAANQVFTFELVDDATGEVIQTKQNVQGTVTFDAIEYKTSDAGKTYTYTIREAATTIPGITIDSTEYKAEVTLTDVGGSLTANVVYKKNGETVTGAAFDNTYEASGEAYLTAVKTVNGAAPAANQVFTFELVDDATGEVIQTKQNVQGTVTFDAIEYKTSDAGKTYAYTIREAATTIPGVTIDSTEYKAEVTLTDVGGSLTTNVVYKKNGETVTGALFDNTYEASGEAYLTATKTVNGAAPAANQVFTFELVDDATGEVIQTKQNVQGTVTFDAIGYKTSDAGKTCTYTIREAATTIPGVTIDNTEYKAEVTLTDVGGSLTANVVYKKNGETVTGAAFNNTYEVSGEAYLTAAKTVNGAAPAANQVFTFELVDGSGAVLQRVQNQGSAISFAPIPYTAADAGLTYTYTIREAETDMAGVIIDRSVYTASVTVTDVGGSLDCAVTYARMGQPVSAAIFNNIIEAKGSFTLAATKMVDGHEPGPADSFVFELLDQNGVVIQRARNIGANITFAPISFTMADVGSTYTYTVRESTEGSAIGMVMDTRYYTVTVNVTHVGNGVLSCMPQISLNGQPVSAIAFLNQNYGDTQVILTAQKTVNGASPAPDQVFTFELLDERGNVLQTVMNNGSAITFAPIRFTAADRGYRYTYQVREKAQSPIPGMIMDEHVYTVQCDVFSGTDGDMHCNVTWLLDGQAVEAAVFNNTVISDGFLTLEARKTVNGASPAPDQVFAFELLDEQGNVLQTVMNNGSAITFAPIRFTVSDVGSHTFRIREKAESARPGMTMDERVYTVLCTVAAGADGKLECTAIYQLDGQTAAAAAFDNTYAAEGSLILTAQKTVNGTAPAEDQRYEFELKDENGNVLQTVTNDGGAIAFAPIRYTLTDAGRAFVYTVSEKTAPSDDMLTDRRVYTVTVTVADQGDGTLKVSRTIAQDGLAVGVILFNNQQLGSLTISKTVAGGDEEAAFRFTVTLRAASGATLTGSYPCSGTALASVRSGDRVTLKHGESITITGLPAGASWTVEEEADAQYSTTVNGVSGRRAEGVIGTGTAAAEFRNTYRETDFAVTKVWQGKRGGEIVLTLYANGVKLEPQPEYQVNGDVYSYDNLPMYGADGERIVYSARETYMEGYTTIYQNVMPDTAVTDRVLDGGRIINRAMTEVSVRKIWTGLELKEGEAYPAIVLTLLCNGEPVDVPQPEPDKHGWYTWRNLPTEVDGREAVYTVVETPLEGFATTYANPDGTAAEFAVSGGVITNHRIPATGDGAPLTLWAAMLGLSAMCLMLLTARRRRV